MTNKYTLKYIKENNLILLESIGGSIAYGLNLPTSDTDIRGIYICEKEDLFSNNFPAQINDEKNDIVFYELGRFLELITSNNPNILELLNTPEDCIIFKHPLFDYILEHKESFITKSCRNSFSGYSISQIKKARGLNKKQNWEKEKVVRKDILDFVYVIENAKSIPWKKWNGNDGQWLPKYDEKFCGVVNIPNARDLYAVYFDDHAKNCFSDFWPEETRKQAIDFRKKEGLPLGFGYKGLVKVGEGNNLAESNQLRLSSIPKGEEPVALIIFNKDAYSSHCKDFKEYSEWIENRNEQRYIENQESGQKLDVKNLMHCIRLINMSKEIGRGEGIIVRRHDREELLKIRRGEVDLESLIEIAENSLREMDEIFTNSNLPEKVDSNLINNLLIKIRKEFYEKAVKILKK